MKAIIEQDNRLVWSEAPDPQMGDHDITIEVKATAVNRADLMQHKGLYPPPPGASPILGLECAGIVKTIGSQVTQYQPGDSVCALLAGGGYAETVVCDQSHALPIPNGFSFEQAAALPEVYSTAWLNLFMEVNLKPGQAVLIHAGASGVGTAAIQLCKVFQHPCFVTVGSQEKLDFCMELGASGGSIRGQQSFVEQVKSWTENRGFGAILDPVGAAYLEDNIKSLATDGSLVVIGIMGGRAANLDMGRLLVKRLRVIGSTLRSRSSASKAALITDLKEKVWPLFESGQLRPIIHRIYPIEQVQKAFNEVSSNQTTGKVVLSLNS